MRAFISVDIEAGPALREVCEELRRTGASLKVVDPDIMHITLKFLGDIQESSVPGILEVMRGAVADLSPFELRMNGMGAFPNQNRIRVVWIGIPDPGPTVLLAERLEKSLVPLGFEQENRAFKPHLTVARSKDSRGMDRVQEVMRKWEEQDFGSQRVRSIRLKRSILGPRGPTYLTLEDVTMGFDEG